MSSEWLSLKESMKYIKIKSYKTLYKFIAQELPVSQIGSTKRIKKSDIDNFMKDHIANH